MQYQKDTEGEPETAMPGSGSSGRGGRRLGAGRRSSGIKKSSAEYKTESKRRKLNEASKLAGDLQKMWFALGKKP